MLDLEAARFIEYAKIIYTLVFLARFSIHDIVKREVADPEVYAYTGGAVLFYIASTALALQYLTPQYVLVQTIFSLAIAPGLFYALYVKGLMGLGDVYVASGLSLTFTYPVLFNLSNAPGTPVILPPVITIILYACASIILYSIVKALYTVLKYKEMVSQLSTKHKILLPILAKPMRIREYLETRFFYPLTIIEEREGGVTYAVRLTYDVEREEYTAHQERLKKLLEKGLVKPDDYIWVSYGIPFLALILMGLVLFLLIGDGPLTPDLPR
ncbi:MAG: A24 family peptidase C-terminal domain-containing protein [Thermosphaera sp.]